jgi:hypothetical protein
MGNSCSGSSDDFSQLKTLPAALDAQGMRLTSASVKTRIAFFIYGFSVNHS